MGKTALPNVLDSSEPLVSPFPEGTINFTYTDDDLTAAGLSSANEPDLFIRKFRSSDHRYVKIGGTVNAAANRVEVSGIAENSCFGIGYDKTPPTVILP